MLMGGRFGDRGTGGGQIGPQQHSLEHAQYLHQPVQRYQDPHHPYGYVQFFHPIRIHGRVPLTQ